MFNSVFISLSLVALSHATKVINVNLIPGHDPYILKNPNYPKPSELHEDITWVMDTQSPARISIHCTDFRFIPTNPCRESYIVINAGEPDEISLCGSNIDYKKVSPSSRMTLRYLGGNWGGGALHCIVQATTTDNVYHYMGADPSEVHSGEAGLIRRPGRRQTSCKCGWVNKNPSRIYGGREIRPHEYPWLVALITGLERRMPICGGSIITQYHVLTAAHCVTDSKGNPTGSTYSVLVGEYDWQADKNDARQVIKVNDIIKFKNYTSYIKDFDIAILNLEREIQFSDRVGPVCLTETHQYMGDEWVKVMGWGRVDDEGYFSTVAKVANVKTVNIHICSAKYLFLMRTEDPFHVCTWAKNDDCCRGDSGGPLVWLDPDTNRYTQVALVSHSMECGGEIPAVQTNVTYLLDWIRTEVTNSNPAATICA
uniref:Venom s1 protease with cub domain 11 n=1 Tax=Pristhesancus plagipennis TaxID=1955184 RepID=A0A1Q1NPI4_PRIPG|nr:venom s1 protease with cub domain 11 [Pristhesancus plagipennis]